VNSITPEDLKVAECQECHGLDPDCNAPLVLSGKCHPRAGSRVVYLKARHALVLTCAACDKHIVDIRLGPAS
jgi:hypothetical protein